MNIAEQTNDINQFIAETVLDMDDETRAAWDSLSDFEKKSAAYAGWTARNAYRRIAFENTRKALMKG